MKSLVFGVAATLLFSVSAVQAQDQETKTIPMAYFSMPFGASQKASEPVFGFRVSQASEDPQGGLNLLQNQRPALLDYQMKNGEPHAFTVNGFNALKKTQVVYANGTTETATTINWKILVPAVLAGGFILYKITDGDGGGSNEVVCVAECFNSF